MTETVAGAVARVQAPKALIENSLDNFARLLPAGIPPDKFTHWALAMVTRALNNPKQAEAWERVLTSEPGRLSVLSALMDAASLGLEPGREYHLVPFGATVTGITDYRGEIHLITNAEPCTVVAMLVRANDDFRLTGANIPPTHEADWFGDDRGPVVGGYSYVDYPDGRCSLVTRMPEAEFLKHREVAKVKTIWDEWPEPQRLKTLVHQVRKYVRWSPSREW